MTHQQKQMELGQCMVILMMLQMLQKTFGGILINNEEFLVS